VISDDGHPVTGAVAFVLAAPGPGASAPPATTAAAPAPAVASSAPGGDSTPVWPWIAGAVLLVAAGVVAALRLGRT